MPSDATWTAIVGLGGITATAATAWSQVRLERARWKVENRRAHDARREDERRERRTAYQRYMIAFNALDSYGTGYPPESDEHLKASIQEFNSAVAGVDLYGTSEVREPLDQLRLTNRQLGAAMAPHVSGGSSLADAFVTAWRSFREPLVEHERHVIAAMRQDVGPLPPSPE